MSRRGRRGAIEERRCLVEGCEKRAKKNSPHCEEHARSAVGRAARRELRDLLREIEKLAEVSDPRLRRRAELRFTRKLESGRYPILFSQELRELQEERRRDAELGVELGSVRLALYRALTEIADPAEMARTIVRLSEESRKVVRDVGVVDDTRPTMRPTVNGKARKGEGSPSLSELQPRPGMNPRADRTKSLRDSSELRRCTGGRETLRLMFESTCSFLTSAQFR